MLNGVTGKNDSVVTVINDNCNPYDLASISSVLLDVEARQRYTIFDTSMSVANVMVKNVVEKPTLVDSGQATALDSGQSQSQPNFVHSTPDYQPNTSSYGRGRGKGHVSANNKP